MYRYAYYKGLFGLRYVRILTKEKYIDMNYGYAGNFFYKYVIEFTSGRLKLVHEDKLIFKE